MNFYQRFEELCAEIGTKPQSKEIQKAAGVSSPAIQGWKENAIPKITPVIQLAQYFHVTTDYLLGLSEVREPSSESTRKTISEEESILLEAYRTATTQGRFNIVTVCMTEMENVQKNVCRDKSPIMNFPTHTKRI